MEFSTLPKSQEWSRCLHYSERHCRIPFLTQFLCRNVGMEMSGLGHGNQVLLLLLEIRWDASFSFPHLLCPQPEFFRFHFLWLIQSTRLDFRNNERVFLKYFRLKSSKLHSIFPSSVRHGQHGNCWSWGAHVLSAAATLPLRPGSVGLFPLPALLGIWSYGSDPRQSHFSFPFSFRFPLFTKFKMIIPMDKLIEDLIPNSFLLFSRQVSLESRNPCSKSGLDFS